MRSRPVSLAVAAALVMGIGAPSARAGISDGQALTIANRWRAEAHIPPIAAMSPAMSLGCEHHNSYMRQNGGELTHEEELGKRGYTVDGDDAARNSVLAYPERTPRIWDDGVYHRMGVLQPRLRTSGFAASHTFTCMQIRGIDDTATTDELTLYPWPPDGAKNVPLFFGGNESPDPYDEVPGVTQLGYLLSVEENGPWGSYLDPQTQVKRAWLVTGAGKVLTVTPVDSDSHSAGYIQSAFALFPRAPLKPATSYTAHADGTVTDASERVYPFSLTWHFKTVGSRKPKLELAKGRFEDGRVRFKLTAGRALAGRTATVKRTTKRPGRDAKVKTSKRTLAAAQTLSAPRPERGGYVRFRVSTSAFAADGDTYLAASASRRYTRR